MDGRSALLSPKSTLLSTASRRFSPTSETKSSSRIWQVSLVLPAFNEEGGIRQAISEACEALEELTTAYEVLVVDDGSWDGTAAIVSELATERRQIRLLRHENNLGYGAALRTGFAAARFERVAFTDADCQFHLADLGRLLPLTERYPVVVGWRVDRKDSWRRRFLSGGYNLLTSVLLGTRVRDCDCALKVFQRTALPDLLPETNTFFVNAEMLTKARQRGLEVAEVGVRHRPRLRGSSKVSLLEVPRILATLLPFWWSKVLFAGDRNTTLPERKLRVAESGLRLSGFAGGMLLLLLSSLLFFCRLSAPLLEPQEPRYAEIPRQMLQEGRFLVPVLHGEPYLDKPPLFYWLIMESYSLFGVHDWAARLVPGLAGVLTVLLTYAWGWRCVGQRAGLCGALVLCLSAGFVYRQRMLNMDSLLCLWVTAALAFAHVALRVSRSLRFPWWFLSAVACGLGLLTKGPVALVLIVGPLLLFTFLNRKEHTSLRARDWIFYLLVAGLLATPWYVAVMVQIPDFVYTFFWKHHVERFLSPFDHEKPSWYYLPLLLAGMMPWTLLLPGFVQFLGRRSLRSGRRRPSALGFFLLSSLVCLVFFSLSGCKRPGYILPALPPLSLALGWYLHLRVPRDRHRLEEGVRSLWQCRSRLARSATLYVLAIAVLLVFLAGAKHLLRPGPMIVMEMLALAGLGWFACHHVSWGACATVTFGALLLAVHYLQPAYNHQFALREPLHAQAVLAEGDRLSIACYPQRWDSISFYHPQADVRVYRHDQLMKLLADLQSRPRTLLLVKSGKSLEELMAELPTSLKFSVYNRTGLVTAGWIVPNHEPLAACSETLCEVCSH